MEVFMSSLKDRIKTMLSYLDEKQSRIYLSIEAKSQGWDGKSKIDRISGVNRILITRGEKELENREGQAEPGRIRRHVVGRLTDST
jgi:hypothetical protein